MKTHLDLFSGIGGFALAAQRVGFTTVAFCEKEPYAQQILKEKFGAVMADTESGDAVHNAPKQERRPASKSADSRPKIHPDIFTLDGADYAGVDLITGGFPCQPFSLAGKRRGKADDRAIWPEMLRVIAEARPRWVLGENVAGIITMELDSVLSDLEGIGYSAWPIVIPACAVDARHRRDRVWIIAHTEHDAGRSEFRAESRQWKGKGPTHEPVLESAGPSVGWNPDAMRCSRNGGTKREVQNENSNTNGICKDVADGPRVQPGRKEQRPERKRVRQSGESIDDPNANSESAEWVTIARSECCYWEPEPSVGRVAHGVPNRAHRLRGLGNAIVPQVAQEILSAISQII